MTVREDVRLVVHQQIAEILPSARISGELHLRELGADSVDRVEILLGVLDRLGLRAPLSDVRDVPNVDALVDVLAERVS
ncbi:acyl carrier protein [Sphaerisporangium album]|uniref:Acyl carrier protein n=1 Tax=Sphaerisporangium album TaxID=509200 RepID=A0A367FBW0_9ACTN|nr:phosphopantetheine-binding protein [Sphaerisporangium album]RCG27070.1 acyl carrier protein [Sphaerisporangium album]